MISSAGINQILVAASTQLIGLSSGVIIGYPSVLLHQLRSNDSSIHLTLESSSWMGSIHGLAGIPSVLMPTIMQWRGRKFAFFANSLLIIIGWVLTYSATDVVTLLLGESFHGLGGHSLAFVSYSVINEMLSKNLKNVCMLSYSTTLCLGIAIVNTMGRFLYWKTISLVMIAPIVLALLMACAWPESPPWLACKGKFEECEKAFVCLRGTDDDSKKELRKLISAHMEMTRNRKNIMTKKVTWQSFWRKVTRRDFYLPTLHMFVLLLMVYWSGYVALITYTTEMVQKATSNENAAFIGGIIINIVLFLSSLTGTILTVFFNNKPILLIGSCGTAASLFGASTVTYLQSVDKLPKDSQISFYFFIAYMITAGIGLSSLAYTVAAEIMPVKHRGIGGAFYTICLCVLHTSSIKLAPYLFLYIDLWGTFLLYMFIAILCSLYVWKYLPETKGKTLQELENYLTFGRFDKKHDIDDDCIVLPIVK